MYKSQTSVRCLANQSAESLPHFAAFDIIVPVHVETNGVHWHRFTGETSYQELDYSTAVQISGDAGSLLFPPTFFT